MIQKAWISACKKKKPFSVESAKVCSKHFCSKDYKGGLRAEFNIKIRQMLKEDAVPTKDIPANLTAYQEASNEPFKPICGQDSINEETSQNENDFPMTESVQLPDEPMQPEVLSQKPIGGNKFHDFQQSQHQNSNHDLIEKQSTLVQKNHEMSSETVEVQVQSQIPLCNQSSSTEVSNQKGGSLQEPNQFLHSQYIDKHELMPITKNNGSLLNLPQSSQEVNLHISQNLVEAPHHQLINIERSNQEESLQGQSQLSNPVQLQTPNSGSCLQMPLPSGKTSSDQLIKASKVIPLDENDKQNQIPSSEAMEEEELLVHSHSQNNPALQIQDMPETNMKETFTQQTEEHPEIPPSTETPINSSAQNYAKVERDNDGNTFFLQAVKTRNYYAVELMIKDGTNLEEKNYKQESALMLSAANEDFKIVYLLLKHLSEDAEIPPINLSAQNYAKIERDNDGNTFFLQAVKTRNYYAIELMIKDGANLEEENCQKESALMLSAANEDFKMVDLLLKHLPKSSDGNTPLHQAALKGQSRLVEVLISVGADLKAKNNLNQTPLHLSSMNLVDLVDKVMRAYKTTTPLDLASIYGHEQVVKILLEAGARVDDIDEDEEDVYVFRVTHTYQNDFVRLFRGHWVT